MAKVDFRKWSKKVVKGN